MGKASSAKKVARAARAGGNRRAGQRRPLGFPITIGAVILLGLALVVFARDERNTNARPRVNAGAAGNAGDHWHEPYSIYTCVTDPETPASSTTTSTTAPADSSASSAAGEPTTTTTSTTTSTTAPVTSTTVAAEGDVPGVFHPGLQDATQDVLGIHSHGDKVIHIHPFASSVSGRRATLDKFFDQVGIRMTDDSFSVPNGTGGTDVYTEGQTKCQGGKDGVLKIARWSNAQDAADGKKPNEIVTKSFGSIRLHDGDVLSITFLPEGSTIPVEKDVAERLNKLTDVTPGTTTTNPQASGSSASSSDAGSSSAGSEASSTSADSASSSASSSASTP